MKILINDANILIDIVKVNLVIEFANLSFELYTTDFIFEEINPEQKIEFLQLINEDLLKIIKTTEIEDFQEINNLLKNSSGLSFEDCSAWYYSKKLGGTLITGDRKLKKVVEKNEIEVRGIIFILDEILKQGLITFDVAIKKINLLYKLNTRLPKTELSRRIMLWEKQK